MQRFVKLRKVGGSLIMAVPIELRRAHDLRPADSVLWDFEGDAITLKLFKVMANRTPALRQEDVDDNKVEAEATEADEMGEVTEEAEGKVGAETRMEARVDTT